MAVPTHPTFSEGEILSASKLNQFVTASKFFTDPPKAEIYRTSTQSFPTGAATAASYVDFTTVQFDNDNMSNIAVDPERLTIATPGYYNIKAQVTPQEPSGPATRGLYRLLEIIEGTSNQISGDERPPVNFNNATTVMSCGITMYLNVGQYLRIRFLHDCSASIGLHSAYGGTRLQVVWTGK